MAARGLGTELAMPKAHDAVFTPEKDAGAWHGRFADAVSRSRAWR